jgi:hypothetical protein
MLHDQPLRAAADDLPVAEVQVGVEGPGIDRPQPLVTREGIALGLGFEGDGQIRLVDVTGGDVVLGGPDPSGVAVGVHVRPPAPGHEGAFRRRRLGPKPLPALAFGGDVGAGADGQPCRFAAMVPDEGGVDLHPGRQRQVARVGRHRRLAIGRHFITEETDQATDEGHGRRGAAGLPEPLDGGKWVEGQA